jgi:transcriptional regulator with XRE-family HTH domain
MVRIEIISKAKKMSQKDWAVKTGIHSTTISQYFTGKKRPSAEHLNLFSALLPEYEKETLFDELNLRPGSETHKSIFGSRKLSPALQVQVDADVEATVKELADRADAKKASLKTRALSGLRKKFGERPEEIKKKSATPRGPGHPRTFKLI